MILLFQCNTSHVYLKGVTLKEPYCQKFTTSDLLGGIEKLKTVAYGLVIYEDKSNFFITCQSHIITNYTHPKPLNVMLRHC